MSHEPARVISLTASDAHPPGYYLALKSWLKLARVAGFEPGTWWARLLGVGAWLVLGGVAWVGSRRLAGERAGTLIAWTVAGNAYAALHARDLRSYAFASLGVFLVFVASSSLSTSSWSSPEVSSGSGGRSGAAGRDPILWLALIAGALFALWSHLLTGLVFAAMALAWLLVGSLAGGRARGWPWRGLIAAGAVVLLGFLPWLLRVREQVGYIRESAPTWMTPASWTNLLTVFTFWLPFGRIGSPGPPESAPLLTPLGLVAVLLPLTLGLVAWIAPRRVGREPGGLVLGTTAAVALTTSVLFVVATWCLARWGVVSIFHGPRYPSLISSLWAFGLAALALWAARRLGRSTLLAVLVLLPLLGCSLVGQWTLAFRESTWGIVNWKRTVPELFPDPGEALYVLPSELAPFVRRSLAEFEIRRIEELPCGAFEAEEVTVLDLNPWPALDRPRDRLARHLLSRPLIGEAVTRRALPEGRDDVRVTHIVKPDADRFGALCPGGFVSRLARELSAAEAIALPEGQGGPSWSWLEIADDLTTGRWGSREVVEMQFDRDLGAGSYRFHLVGERQPFPTAEAEIRVELREVGWSHRETVGTGGFHLVVPITLDRDLPAPVAEIAHPTWSPNTVGLSGDRRTLGFLLRAAWFERASRAR